MVAYGQGVYGASFYGGDLSTAGYTLEVAFNENIAGVFTLDSALAGPDALTDLGRFTGTFDDVTDDAQAPYQVVFGTDQLMSAVQAGNLTVTVARVDDPGYWNPNNPGSPLNANAPGFIPMRPIRLTATVDGVDYGLFRGYLRHANWDSSTRSCELYAEDFLLWASRVYPVIASTGPSTMGAVFRMLVAAVDPTLAPVADAGISLDDFSADGTQSVTQILASLLEADLGTVFVNGDGVPVYEQHDTPLGRTPSVTVTVTDQASSEQSGIDLDTIGTRVAVEKTDPETGEVIGTWGAVDSTAEQRFGRADISAVSSPYVPSDGQSLADELVYEGVLGKPPVTVTLGNVDAATLQVILTTSLNDVIGLADDFGGTSGDAIVQRIAHTIQTGLHEAELLLQSRTSRAFALDSPLDGTDTFRYP